MKLDLIKHVVAELAEPLAGARVSKIYQPAPEIILFKLWNGRETLRLLLSTEVPLLMMIGLFSLSVRVNRVPAVYWLN